MLSKAAKSDIVEQFSEVFKANPSVVLVEYKGLTVKELEGLRSNLKGVDTELKVVKNTLAKKALDNFSRLLPMQSSILAALAALTDAVACSM